MKVKFIDKDVFFNGYLTVGKTYTALREYEKFGNKLYDLLANDHGVPMNGIYKDRFYLIKGETNMNKNNNTLLPEDVDNVIFNGGNTVVTLKDGSKGVSKCDETDEFDPYTGYSLAYYKAKHDKNFELKRMFNGCIEYSKKKSYKQTIIKNK